MYLLTSSKIGKMYVHLFAQKTMYTHTLKERAQYLGQGREIWRQVFSVARSHFFCYTKCSVATEFPNSSIRSSLLEVQCSSLLQKRSCLL